MESEERRLLRQQYPGQRWNDIVSRLPEERVQVLYKKFIAEMLERYQNWKKEQS